MPRGEQVIGRAFRRSLVVIAAIAIAGVAAFLLSRDSGSSEETREKDAGEIAGLPELDVVIPRVRFTDVTEAAGVDFVHRNGATGEKLLPETMAGGVAFIDHDSDGDPDLLFVSGTAWDGTGRGSSLRLYENDGRGRFTDVTGPAGLDASLYGMGVAAGDVDNDGDTDLFITAVGSNRLFENDDGRFTDVTVAAGVAGDDDGWGSSAGFFDADGDGDLDLFVLNYVRWSREIDLAVAYTLNGRDRAYGPPVNFAGAHPHLYENDGTGKFREVSEPAGVRVLNSSQGTPVAKALALTFHDHDGDGDLDVFVANDTVRNFLFENDGGMEFTEVGEEAGFAYDSSGTATGAMGIDVAWFRNDGTVGVGVGNFANEATSLFVAEPDLGLFSCESTIEGIAAPSRPHLTFGVLFLDFDLDGRLDFLAANGHLEDEIAEVQSSQEYRQPAQLFWNAGSDARRCFVEVPATPETEDLRTLIVGRGVSAADLDGDGDLDVVLTQTGGRPLLLRNDQATGHHWLRVRVVGGNGANRDGIGALVTLTAGGVTQRRIVNPTRGYLSQTELPLTFGLGASTKVDSLVVTWPDGRAQTVSVSEVDTLVEVPRGE
ncbi:MAG: CRTAC1 family protein [Planctomycetota bacterium]